MGRRTYIDSSIVLEAILSKASSDAKRILYKLRGSEYEVIIPHVVMGEVFSQIFSKSDQKELYENLKFLSGWIMNLVPDPSTQMPVPTKESYDFAIDLMKHDKLIDACDALLVSHALLDTEAYLLLTYDRYIQNSNYIAQKIEELGSNIRIKEVLK